MWLKRLWVSLLISTSVLLLLLLSNSGQLSQEVTWRPPRPAEPRPAHRTRASGEDLSWRRMVRTEGINRTKPSRLVIYNRVDKAGSSTLQTLIFRLGMRSRAFKTEVSKLYWSRYLSRKGEAALANFLINKSRIVPFVYSRHVSYVDFARLKKRQPIYINLIRNPVDRFVSRNPVDRFVSRNPVDRFVSRNPVDRFVSLFHFLRSNRRKLKNSTDTTWLKKNLTECVLSGDPECAMSQEYSHRRSGQNPEFFQPMTAFFCGHEPFCRSFNSRPALQKALQNLELRYSVVGVLETFRKSLSVFEAFVPEYFKNIGKLYDKAQDKKVNQNPNHAQPPAAVRDILARRMTSDIELYMFAKQRLHLQFKRIRPRPQRRLTSSTAV